MIIVSMRNHKKVNISNTHIKLFCILKKQLACTNIKQCC